MIFWKLFLSFCKIGIVNFGGGYAMIALIQHEVVEKNNWLTLQEFTDIVATSQMTPGPIGINVATYTGYTAVLNEGYAEWMAVVGAFLASFSVILLPFLLMLLVTAFLMRYRHHKRVEDVLKTVRERRITGKPNLQSRNSTTPNANEVQKSSPSSGCKSPIIESV